MCPCPCLVPLLLLLLRFYISSLHLHTASSRESERQLRDEAPRGLSYRVCVVVVFVFVFSVVEAPALQHTAHSPKLSHHHVTMCHHVYHIPPWCVGVSAFVSSISTRAARALPSFHPPSAWCVLMCAFGQPLIHKFSFTPRAPCARCAPPCPSLFQLTNTNTIFAFQRGDKEERRAPLGAPCPRSPLNRCGHIPIARATERQRQRGHRGP